MTNLYHDEIKLIRKMADDEAFLYIIDKYSSDDELLTLHALNIIGHRPWRRKFHRVLAEHYIQNVHKDTFRIAIRSFLTFMRPEDLSGIIWAATDKNLIDRDFARYFFVGEVARKFGIDHESLKIWVEE